MQASWEVDLTGRLGKLRGAARSHYLASIEGANLVITNLVAEVAGAYYELLALDHSREVLRQTLARQAQALEMIRAQKESGRTNELAVQQFEAQLADTRALDAATSQEAQALENRLNLLLGRLPQPLRRDKQQLQLAIAATVAAGVPSDLLRNRPDIREAELAVQASRLELEAARAAFYPSLSITASLGYQAFHPKYLLSTPDSIVGSIAGGLLAPLFNRKELEAAFSTAEASQRQAMIQYQQVVLTSFAEVATGLYALQQAEEIANQRRYRSAAVAGTVSAADALFRAGKASYLEVLLAEQSTLEAELELVRAQRDQHLVAVQLYRALGGGWRDQIAPGAVAAGATR